jgi:DNA/RNA endonuclease G (NUC1)
LVNPKQIGIPDYTWKIIVPLRPGQGLADITANNRIISVIMPNFDTTQLSSPLITLPNGRVLDLSVPQNWTSYAVSVRDIEALTGYNFFSQLSQNLQDAIEQQTNTSFSLS